jgi:putative oxidoreductase
MPSTDARRGVLLRIVTGLLAVVFFASGVVKLIPLDVAVQGFARWGYPDWFRIAVGLAEVVGAVLLVVPSAQWIGAAGLSIMMVGAAITHLMTQGEAARVLVPVVLFLLLLGVAFADEIGRAVFHRGPPRPGEPARAGASTGHH